METISQEQQQAKEVRSICPRCGKYWPFRSEQGASIDLFGGCLACRKEVSDDGDYEQIMEESARRGAYDNPGILEERLAKSWIELRCPQCQKLVYKPATSWTIMCPHCEFEWEDIT